MKTNNTRRRTWISVLVIIGIVVVFLLLVDVGAVFDELRNADWVYLGLAVVALIIGYFIQTLRWRRLLGNIPPIKFTFHTMNISTFTSLLTFIPVTPIRVFFMGESDDVTIPQATSSLTLAIIFDWVMKIVALLGALVLFAPVNSNAGTIILFIGVIVLIFAGILILVHNLERIVSWATPFFLRRGILKEEQVEGLFSGLAQGLKGVGSTKQVALIFLISLVAWTFFIIFYILGLLAFNIDLQPEVMLATVLVAAFLVNPSGPYLPGVFNVLLVVPMALVSGADIEALVAYSIVIYAVLLVIWLLLGTWAMRMYKLSFNELRQRAREGIEIVRQVQEATSNETPGHQ